MATIGKLRTTKSIENAQSEIRHWLEMLNIGGMNIILQHDARQNIALVRFKYKDKEYEFRSTAQSNCRLNMHAIARVMEGKVRFHLMGIEKFDKSMHSYLMIEGRVDPTASPITHSDSSSYATLGISPLASNEELLVHYKKMAKSWHPDMAGSEEAKDVFQNKFSEINQAWETIRKERGI